MLEGGGYAPDPGASSAARAAELRALAGDIETVLDAAVGAARSANWDCPNADDVRGQLGIYQRAAQSAAADLRDEATLADAAATRAREDAAEPEEAR